MPSNTTMTAGQRTVSFFLFPAAISVRRQARRRIPPALRGFLAAAGRPGWIRQVRLPKPAAVRSGHAVPELFVPNVIVGAPGPRIWPGLPNKTAARQ